MGLLREQAQTLANHQLDIKIGMKKRKGRACVPQCVMGEGRATFGKRELRYSWKKRKIPVLGH